VNESHDKLPRLAAALWLSAIILPAAQGQAPEPGNAIAGQALYYDHACYSCHGYTGETGVRSLLGSGFLFNEAIFVNYLRQRADQNPTLPSTQMPNYPAESLSDAEARDLYAYIKTFDSNTPPLEDIPVLNEILDAAERPYEP
jgi:mono/diheme cytochrome c family protein